MYENISALVLHTFKIEKQQSGHLYIRYKSHVLGISFRFTLPYVFFHIC